MESAGLVLEGGGMRGLYTAGVLEYFLEKNLMFPYVIGVSAGACMAASYLSRQKGRNEKVNIGLASDPRYLSFRNFLKKRELFGMDFLFDEIPNRLVPFDFETFLASKEKFIVGTTDCEDGTARYFTKEKHGKDMMTIIRASSSLPLLAPPVKYGNYCLLDGGIVDPIPLEKAVQDGNKKNVIILTKDLGYAKKRTVFSRYFIYALKHYPQVAAKLVERYKTYNHTLEYIKEEVRMGRAVVIQPSQTISVRRIEKNQQKLRQLYHLGYRDATHHYANLLSFLN